MIVSTSNAGDSKVGKVSMQVRRTTARTGIYRNIVFVLTACAVILAAAPSSAVVRVEAFAGHPVGVARVTFNIDAGVEADPASDARFTVVASDGRPLYPVFQQRPARSVLRGLLNIGTPRSASLLLVFRGAEPFELKTYTPKEQVASVRPVANNRQHRRLLNEWWTQTCDNWRRQSDDGAFPPIVENYLVASHARRYGLTIPDKKTGLLQLGKSSDKVWDSLLFNERAQLKLDQELLLSPPTNQSLGSLPPPMPWFGLDSPTSDSEPDVEALADYVPAECAYIRFGNFTNYLWFRDLSRKWQGDVGNMIARRAIDSGGSQRIEQQLSLHETALSKLLGPQVIDDVALLVGDPWLKQGAAVGMLFKAKNSFLLRQNLNSQRRESLEEFSDATESNETIGAHQVSLISTPDGQVRSYYAEVDEYHFVATSRSLMRRFLQASAGEQRLSESVGFHGIRAQLPASKPATLFAYVSPDFLQNAASPAVWLEARRRTQSMRQIHLMRLARAQARAEGLQASTTEELIAADLLPPDFGQRNDGSTLTNDEQGFLDSLRGRPGNFLPAGDVTVEQATEQEAEAYRTFADRFRQEVGQTPPIAVSIERTAASEGVVTLLIDVLATPLDRVKLGRIPDILGPPSTERLAPVEGDLIHAEVVVDAPLSALLGEQELHHLFAGVQDFRLPLVARGGELSLEPGRRQMIRMYWGSWPKPGMLRWLLADAPAANSSEPAPGPQQTWQALRDEFLLMSFNPDVTSAVLPQLNVIPSEAPGQAWLDVADISATDLAAAVNAFGYGRTRETSMAATRLMNALTSQLAVPIEECRTLAEQLVEGEFTCPLGGDYEIVQVGRGVPVWASSAVEPENQFLLQQPPEDFQLPLLTWFRGLRANVLVEDEMISGHVEIDMTETAIPQ